MGLIIEKISKKNLEDFALKQYFYRSLYAIKSVIIIFIYFIKIRAASAPNEIQICPQ